MLILPIKKQWYDMILSGKKKEEYREIKPYYNSRFTKAFDMNCCDDIWSDKDSKYEVMFRNGYSKKSPSFVARVSMRIGAGKPEWDAEPGKEYYVLKILEICRK